MLGLVTAGESHGPALVAVLTGLPAGLRLDREAVNADLRAASRATAAARGSSSRPTRSRCSPDCATHARSGHR